MSDIYKGGDCLEGYKSVNDIANEWGINPRTVRGMCKDGRLVGAEKVGRDWLVPKDAKRPADGRVTTGEYRNWRKK